MGPPPYHNIICFPDRARNRSPSPFDEPIVLATGTRLRFPMSQSTAQSSRKMFAVHERHRDRNQSRFARSQAEARQPNYNFEDVTWAPRSREAEKYVARKLKLGRKSTNVD